MAQRAPLMADLSKYLDKRGCISVNGERASRLADFLTQLVVRVTMTYGLNFPLGIVHCRHKRCKDRLQVLSMTTA